MGIDYFKSPKLRKAYYSYLRSQKWKDTAITKIILVGRRCELCGYPKNLHVHHKTYENFGDELMSDLEVRCRYCHEYRHGQREEPGSNFTPKIILRKGGAKNGKEKSHLQNRGSC